MVTNTTADRLVIMRSGKATLMWKPRKNAAKSLPSMTFDLRVSHADGAPATMLEPGAMAVFACEASSKRPLHESGDDHSMQAKIALEGVSVDPAGVPHRVRIEESAEHIPMWDLAGLHGAGRSVPE
jgi:hypothetical protein